MSFSKNQEIQGHRSSASCSDSPSWGIKSPSLFLSSGNLPGWLAVPPSAFYSPDFLSFLHCWLKSR
jgi:hypothetical protein